MDARGPSFTILAAALSWPVMLAASDAVAPANLVNQDTVSLGPTSELVVTFPLRSYLKRYGNLPSAVNLTIVGPIQPCNRVIVNNVGFCDNYVLTAYLWGGGASSVQHTVTVPMKSLFEGYLPLEPGQNVVDNTGYLYGQQVMDGFWEVGSPSGSSCAAATLKAAEYNMQDGCLFGGETVDLHLMAPGQPSGNSGFVVGMAGYPLKQTILLYLNGPNGSVQAIPQSVTLNQH